MPDLPRFKYFVDPVKAGSFRKSDEPCDCCGKARGWLFDGVMYRENNDEPRVCPWCIADGSAADTLHVSFNTIEHEVSDVDREEIEKRTPAFVSMQDLYWLACCGEPCVFRGHAQYKELTEVWPEAGKALLATYEPGWLGTASPEEFLACFDCECDPGAYVFQCGTCGTFHVPWDRG